MRVKPVENSSQLREMPPKRARKCLPVDYMEDGDMAKV